VQMPVMDGFEATRAIRQLPTHGTTPILAMTANAFEEDRRQCLDAGMDDHLGKPVQPEDLYRALRRWLPRTEPKATPPGNTADIRGSMDQGELREQLKTLPGLDLDAGLRPLRGQLNTYLRLLSSFSTNHARDATELREQLAAGDHGGARQQAHRLKGVAGTLGLLQVRSLASELESGLRDGAAEADIHQLALVLETELQSLVHALSATLPTEETQSSATLDWPQVRSLIERIEGLLTDDDTQVNQLFRNSAPLLIAALGPAAQEIQRLIDSFEYNSALNRLHAAKAGRPEFN
jgi:two-component system, sensor histidine kinase and response regulator